MSSSRAERAAAESGTNCPLLAAAQAFKRVPDGRVERVAERRAGLRLREYRALGERRAEAVEKFPGAHRMDAAALGDVAQHRVVRDDRDAPGRLAGTAVGEPLDDGVGRLPARVDD